MYLSMESMLNIPADCAKPILIILVSFERSDTYNKSSLVLAAFLLALNL